MHHKTNKQATVNHQLTSYLSRNGNTRKIHDAGKNKIPHSPPPPPPRGYSLCWLCPHDGVELSRFRASGVGAPFFILVSIRHISRATRASSRDADVRRSIVDKRNLSVVVYVVDD